MKKEIQQKNARQTIHLSSRKHKEMGHSTRVGGQSEPYLHEILDGPLSHLTLSTTSKAALMRFNGVLLYELGLWGHAGVEEGELWLFTDVLYPIIFMLSGGRNGKHELNGAFHMWSNLLLTSGWEWVGFTFLHTRAERRLQSF